MCNVMGLSLFDPAYSCSKRRIVRYKGPVGKSAPVYGKMESWACVPQMQRTDDYYYTVFAVVCDVLTSIRSTWGLSTFRFKAEQGCHPLSAGRDDMLVVQYKQSRQTVVYFDPPIAAAQQVCFVTDMTWGHA